MYCQGTAQGLWQRVWAQFHFSFSPPYHLAPGTEPPGGVVETFRWSVLGQLPLVVPSGTLRKAATGFHDHVCNEDTVMCADTWVQMGCVCFLITTACFSGGKQTVKPPGGAV